MAVFAYKAIDALGRAATGTLTADTPADGRRLLRDRGLRIARFSPALAASDRTGNAWNTLAQRLRAGAASRRADRVADSARELALLLRSGVPLADALDVLIRQHPRGGWQTVLRDVRERVTGGAALADALAAHPLWFDGFMLAAVRVGQRAGTLESALTQLAAFLKERSTLRQRVSAVLVYPMILLVLGIGVTLFLMTHVLPQLLTVITASGQPLPRATAWLKAASDLLVARWPLLAALALALIVAVAAVLRTAPGRRALHGASLRVPLVGGLLRKTLVARFAQQMAMLLGTGIPFVEALRLVRGGTRHAVLAEELSVIEQRVEAGADIAPALAGSRVFPPVVVQLVAVGQNAGELPAMLGELRTAYETEVNLALGKFTAALEPLLIVLLAGMIGFIIFATVLPILQATEVMR